MMEEEENNGQDAAENVEPTETDEKNKEDNLEPEIEEPVITQNEENVEVVSATATEEFLNEDQETPKDSRAHLEEFELQYSDKPKTGEEEKNIHIIEGISETAEDIELSSDDVREDEDEEEEQEEMEDARREDDDLDDDFDQDSVFTRGRGSISYKMGPRIRDIEEQPIVSGDFLIPEEGLPFKFYKYMDEKDEEECEEESEAEEEEITIDREPYYEKYESLLKETANEKLKNNILQKKLAKFFKRRKMEHVLKETDQQFDTQEKYKKKLDAYGELSDLDYLQRTTITTELEHLKTDRESKFHELNKLFEDLQTQEKDTGYGLIYTKTGKPIPDKLVERLLSRQKQQMQTVGDMRLKHIQLKNMVAEKQNEISILDKIGENLYLMDYEQLKVENRSYMDKMEEKDEELSRLRNKCQKTIQILAHMREKSAALESDIYDLNDDLANFTHNSMEVRGNLNGLKQQRDYYRNMTNKLREESGLLTETELLRDMEVSIEEVKSMTEELECLKEENKIKAQQIRNIRKNIEFPPEGLKRTQKNISDKTTIGRRLYKGRPSLHKPTLPEDAFKHLKNFRGKPTFDKCNRKILKLSSTQQSS